MTPAEVHMAFAAARERRKEDVEARLTLAWHVAALQRREKLPDLKALLAKARAAMDGPKARKPPSVAAQRGVLEILSAQYGIPLRRGRAKR